jgi:hypothetical protein
VKEISPAFCGGDWSPIVAAGPQSALSGVLAGFVFTAITVILTTSFARSDVDKEEHLPRSYALQLFASAFIVLALDSYFTSVTAGELACSRAYAESALSGGILGDGALLMIAGLGWLIVLYSGPVKGLETVLSYINWGVWFVVIIMLAISGVSVGGAMLPGRSHAVINTIPWILGIAMTVVVVIIARVARTVTDGTVIARWVRNAALSGLGSAICGGLFTGIASAFAARWWIQPPSLVVYAVVVFSMLVPAVPLFSTILPAIAARNSALNHLLRKHSDLGGLSRGSSR